MLSAKTFFHCVVCREEGIRVAIKDNVLESVLHCVGGSRGLNSGHPA